MAMIGFQKSKSERVYLVLLLVFFCTGLSIWRAFYSNSIVYLFLNWNLILAAIPWIITRVIFHQNIIERKWLTFILLIIWISFFPNGPYILTDLYHLRYVANMPIWFDHILILSFAWTGLVFSFLSLIDFERLLIYYRVKSWKRIISIIIVLFLTGFGIYVGRYLRWNSWDIIYKPMHLFSDLFDIVLYPKLHPRAWGLTILFGLFLNLFYWSFWMIRSNSRSI